MSNYDSILPESPTQPSRRGRQRLTLLVVVIGLVAAVALGYHFVRKDQVRQNVYTRILETKADNARTGLADFVQPLRTTLEVIRGWGREGDLQGDRRALQTRLQPLLDPIAQASTLHLVLGGDTTFALERGHDGWTAAAGDEVPSYARREDWLADVTAQDEAWLDVNLRERAQGPRGLLIAVGWTSPEGVAQGALLATGSPSLVDCFAGLDLTEHALLAVIHAGDVLWFPADTLMAPDPALPLQEAWLHQLLESDNEASQVLAETIFDWKSAGTRVDQPIQRRIAGRSWWVLFRELSRDAGPEYLGLWVPAGDLAARLQTPDTWETYALVGGLAVAILALISLAFEYRRRLRTMAADRGHCRDSADELRLLIARGESDRLEFKSTMRWNLKTNKPGKEIELAWLKTVVAFLNTDGGTILLGVADDGQILGIAPDGFKNDDKFLLHFNNLINRHVGVEFTRYLRFDLRSIGDKTIFVLDCYSSDDPAFLKRDDDDTFYVRIGPASRKLSLRKTLEYLEQL